MPYSGQKIFPILNVNLNHFDIIGWNSNGIALIGSSGNILAHKKLVFLLWFLYIQVIYSYIKLLVNWMFLLLLEFLILSIELLLYSRPKNTLKVYNPALVEFQALDIPSRVHVQCQRGER